MNSEAMFRLILLKAIKAGHVPSEEEKLFLEGDEGGRSKDKPSANGVIGYDT